MTSVAVRLRSVVDWAGFSQAVRALRAEGVAPDEVRWRIDGADDVVADLFDTSVERRASEMASSGTLPLPLPRSFVDAARAVFLHADPARLPLIHRLALRIAERAETWADPLHEDRLQFDRYQREVRREIHKMHAFVRFRRIDGADSHLVGRGIRDAGPGGDVDDTGADDAVVGLDEGPGRAADVSGGGQRGADAPDVRHVAWFEPAHHVLEAAAPFFARRFATMRWAILTPRASVEWDGVALAFGPGAQREDAPAADAGEALWLAYYRSIFNPARVKVAMMKREMPVRFWKNLPEAAQVSELLAEAPRRSQLMVDAGGAERLRRRAAQAAVLNARHGAVSREGGVESLDAMARRAARCRDCPGADAATQTVFGEGDARARVMIVGEQPGDQEDLRGKPFQGPAGQLLRTAIGQLGWPAEALYLTNAVKHFHHELRGKRRLHKTPGQREAEACLHWLESEIDAMQPRAIVALGATAARSLLGAAVSVTAHDGQWLQRADGVPVLVCLHPAAILRADPQRRDELHARWLANLAQATPWAQTGPLPADTSQLAAA